MSHLAFDRAAMLQRLESEHFDVLVIGGGITGVGCALDAASRGLRTALVERDDFASGTSSKSSKLVHGGLRYLQQGEVRLVYQALRERQRLRRNARHLVRVMPFMIPILTKDGVVSKKIARALGSAMWMYDLTGGWRIGRIHRRLRAAAALGHLPTMPPERLASAYLYFDAATDDARLCLTVARTAADHGAAVANGCTVVALEKDERGGVVGAEVEADGRRFSVRATVVVNAAGVWSDDVRALDEGSNPDSIRPAKGIHVTVPWEKVRNDIAVVIPVPRDKRSLFVVPWGPNADGTFRHTYVGTTDTDYDGPLDDPQCTSEDLDYVLRALNASVTTAITRDDITGAWAGLRPLVKREASGRTADLSRRHRIATATSGVISVTGGKLTTYREMAEDTVDAALERLGRRARCRTKRLALHGAEGFRDDAPAGSLAAHLAGRFGTDATAVQRLIDADPTLGSELIGGLPYVRAEAVYAARHEMVRSLDDLLSRRTRARLLDRAATAEAAETVARLVAPELGWDEDETARQVAELLASVRHEIDSEQPVPIPGGPG
ncbi:MAG: glycerol-3-phosphate dehydrogenase/oxidase [Acidimicrobiia bacterium]